MKPKYVKPSERLHLSKLPYSVEWSSLVSGPFPGFASATHHRLNTRGWLMRVGGRAGVAHYELTPEGRDILKAQEAAFA